MAYDSKTIDMSVSALLTRKLRPRLCIHEPSHLWLGILMHFESAEHNKSSLEGSHLVKAEWVQSWAMWRGTLLKQNDCGAGNRILGTRNLIIRDCTLDS